MWKPHIFPSFKDGFHKYWLLLLGFTLVAHPPRTDVIPKILVRVICITPLPLLINLWQILLRSPSALAIVRIGHLPIRANRASSTRSFANDCLQAKTNAAGNLSDIYETINKNLAKCQEFSRSVSLFIQLFSSPSLKANCWLRGITPLTTIQLPKTARILP